MGSGVFAFGGFSEAREGRQLEGVKRAGKVPSLAAMSTCHPQKVLYVFFPFLSLLVLEREMAYRSVFFQLSFIQVSSEIGTGS